MLKRNKTIDPQFKKGLKDSQKNETKLGTIFQYLPELKIIRE